MDPEPTGRNYDLHFSPSEQQHMSATLNNPTFRLADPEDAALVQTISAKAYVSAYQPVMGYVPKPAIEDYSERIRGQNVWIAEIDGEPSGVLVLEPSTDYLTIYSIAVLPNRQGFGLGRSLLSFAEDRARAMGLPEVRLYTNRHMERNVALYRAAGFIEVGSHPHPSRAGEVLVDMAKTSGGIPQDQS
jgi:ribosomal protein S18 acetylase RimI-like enzyme